MVVKNCALCGKNTSLKKSHIVPKFVGKWLKETSATGFLRGVKNPNFRLQDLPKMPLLCGDCEQLFSDLESYFARNIFYPILNEKKETIEYNENLNRFIVSLNWRTLVTSLEDQLKVDQWIENPVKQAEEIWRKYLLKEIPNAGSYEHHMSFMGKIPAGMELTKILHWYLLRSTDATLASNQVNVFAYTHFPHFFFVSTIVPFSFPVWKTTKIKSDGKFTIESQINDYDFWDFLKSRGEVASVVLNNSANKQIAKSLEKNPEKLLTSESFLVFREVSKRKRLKRIENLPLGIKALIDILDRSADNPSLDHLTQRRAYMLQHEVADDLSKLSISDAIIIDQLLQSTYVITDETNKLNSFNFETKELIVQFTVALCDNKEEQIKLLDREINKLKNTKDPEDKRIIVVFTVNPLDSEMPYETGYYIH